mgnify:CR=1 FL=1
MLTPDEYMALMRLITSERESEGSSLSDRRMDAADKPKRVSKKAKSSRKKLSTALREANARYRKKDGSLRTGRTQADIMRLAQRLKKKM